MLNTVGMSRIGSRFAALREPGFDTKEPRRPLTRRVRLLGCCRHRGRRLNRARPPLMTLSCQSTANFAVVHNGPHDVVAYGRRPMGGLGETASNYEP